MLKLIEQIAFFRNISGRTDRKKIGTDVENRSMTISRFTFQDQIC